MRITPKSASNSGSVLIWALAALLIVAGAIVAGSSLLKSNEDEIEVMFRAEAQALDIARAGLIDAFAWFRREENQPVTTFAPERNLSVSPPINETDDASIGLVREFAIANGYVARYEVRYFSDDDSSGGHSAGEGVFDVTSLRGLTVAGSLWHLESRGYIYRQLDESKAWNEEPNYRVAGAVAVTEVRRLVVSPPAAAALCSARGDDVSVNSSGRIDGVDVTGVVYPNSTGTISSSGDVTGDPATAAIPDYDDSFTTVFGATLPELREMATIQLSAGDTIPSPLPDFPFVFHDGDLTIDSSAPLTGTGLLVVDGDLTFDSNNGSFFTGVIYVTGDYYQEAPSLIQGTVIVNGDTTVNGFGDLAELIYDEDIVDRINSRIGPYRFFRGVRRIDSDPFGGVR